MWVCRLRSVLKLNSEPGVGYPGGVLFQFRGTDSGQDLDPDENVPLAGSRKQEAGSRKQEEEEEEEEETGRGNRERKQGQAARGGGMNTSRSSLASDARPARYIDRSRFKQNRVD